MPDVGNLNIEITSNASEASKSLYNVADALSRIKSAIPNNGIGLSAVATELNKFAKQINQAKATNAVLQNIANFGKGLKDMTSAIKATSKDFDTSKITGAIDAIKASVGDGIKLGQSGTQLKNLKDALGGDWNTEKAHQAGEALKFIAEGAKSLTGTNLGTIAKNVSAVAKALDEYATASGHMMSAVGGNRKTMSDVWETVDGASSKGNSRLPVNLQFHGWREDMSGMADATKEVENTASSLEGLKEVADVLKGFKTSKNDGANIEALAVAVDHLKRVLVGGIPLTAMINSLGRLNEKAGEIKSNGTIEALRDLAEVLARVKESTDGMQAANIKINFGGGRGSRKSSGDVAGVENVMQQSAREVDATFTDVQSTVRSIAEDIGNINASLVEMNNVGRNNAEQMERMARAFAYMFEMASKMRSARALPWGSMNGLPEKGFVYGEGTVDGDNVARIANETRDIILYDENMEQSWEHIAIKIEAAKRELDDYFASQKQVIFGNESIKGIYEDIRFGPTLAGFYGKNAQANMIGQISKGTGLSIENITEQLYNLSNGTINLKDALEKTASSNVTSGMEAVGKAISDVGTDSIDSASKLELLRQKLEIINRLKDRRIDALASRGMDPFNDKTVVNYMLKIIQLNEQIEKMIELNKQATMSNNGMEKITSVEKMSDIDIMVAKYEATKKELADAYDQGRLTTEQYYNAGLKLHKLTEQIEEMKKSDAYLVAVKQRLDEIGNSSVDGATKIELLNGKIRELQEKIAERKAHIDVFGENEGDKHAIEKYMLQIMRVNDQIEKLKQKADESSKIVPWQMQDVDNLVNQNSEIDLLTMKMEGMKQAMLDAVNQGKLSKQQIAEYGLAIQKVRDNIEKLKNAQDGATSSAKSLGLSWADVKKGITAMFPTLTGLIKRFSSMIKMRAIRYVIRQIAAGFREGVENVYNYSKAIGSAFAPAMNEAKTALSQMKNSFGAMAAPAIQALLPVVQSVINAIIEAVNWVNQFFALLNGQKTWTRALPKTVDAFDKQEKGAKKASAAMKDLLADWDELNIIQSQNSGGGGTGTQSKAEEYLEMFEEVYRFDNDVKETVEFIKENFETIKTLALAIGGSIALWRLSSAFGKDLSLLQKLEVAGGLVLMITGIKLAKDAGYSIGKNGLNGENVGDAVLSVLSGAGGGALIGFVLGNAPGAIIGAIVGTLLTLTVMAIEMKKGELDALYGDVAQDVTEIKEDIENNLLTVQAKVTIDVFKAQLKSLSLAKGKVRTALKSLTDTYPVSVSITPDKKEDFRNKINDLVEETNRAAQENAEFMKKVYVPATALVTPKIIDDAWGLIESSVQNLGKQIGDELDKQITDNVKLDELQTKLERISLIMVDVTKTSEFSGAVSVAGAKLRANNFSDYNRETVQAYMDAINSKLSETMGDALGQAQNEYESIATLIEGLKEATTNGTLTDEKELERAIQRLELFKNEYKKKFGIDYDPKVIPDIQAYAQTLYDKWTQPGMALYEKDIYGVLSAAMKKSKDGDVRKIASTILNLPELNSKYSYTFDDENIDDWIDWVNSALIGAISEETGMKLDSVQGFVNNSKYKPLDFFDKEYIKKFQNDAMELLSTQNLSKKSKEKYLEAFGLTTEDYDNYVKEQKKKAQKAAEEAAKAAEQANIEAFEDAKKELEGLFEDNVFSKTEQGYIKDKYGEYALQESMNEFNKYLDEKEKRLKNARAEMLAAFENDSKIDAVEEFNLRKKYTDLYNDLYEELSKDFIKPEVTVTPVVDEEGLNGITTQSEIIYPDGVPIKVNPYVEDNAIDDMFLKLQDMFYGEDSERYSAGFESVLKKQLAWAKIVELKEAGDFEALEAIFDYAEQKGGLKEAFELFYPDNARIEVEPVIDEDDISKQINDVYMKISDLFYGNGSAQDGFEKLGGFESYEQKGEYFKKILELQQAQDRDALESLEAILDFANKYGMNLKDAIDEFEENGGGYGGIKNNNKIAQITPARVSGSMGVSVDGWTPRQGSTTSASGEEEVIDYSQMQTSVENGTRDANEDIVSQLRTMANYLSQLLAKDWTVNVTPSTALGRTVGMSQRDYGKVTGDSYSG